MDEKRKHQIPVEQRFLLNFVHGPPMQPPVTGDLLPSDVQKSGNDGVYHPGGPCAGLRVVDESGCMLATPAIVVPYLITGISPGFCGNNYYHPGTSSSHIPSSDKTALNDGEEQRPKIVDHKEHLLQKQNEELQRALAKKSEEVADLRMKLSQLTERLNELPNVSTEDYAAGGFINLTTTNEFENYDHLEERQLGGEDDMLRSVQCSEQSLEPTHGIGWNDGNGEFGDKLIHEKKTGRGPSSSSSFEIVSPVTLASPTADRHHRDREPRKADDERTREESKLMIRELEVQIKMLGTELEAEKLERIAGDSRINVRLDEVQANVNPSIGVRTRSENAAAATPLGVDPHGCSPEMSGVVSELKAAKWKLTEQTKELMRENEELKRMEQEWRSSATMRDVNKFKKLEEELQRQTRRVVEMEDQLQAEHHCLLEAEARAMELERKNPVYQQGTEFSETSEALATENSLLKHQIEAYKEDFEIERRDREKLIGERDVFKRYFETLRSEVDVARQQLRKYEDDIYSLRSDNNALRTKLRDVTEELSDIQDLRYSKMTPPPPAATPRDYPVKTKAVDEQNTLIPTPSTPLAGLTGDWKCRACTFGNPAARTCCEMCGTQNESARSPGGACAAPSVLTSEHPGVHWNLPPRSTPLLSNLRNFGDIETD